MNENRKQLLFLSANPKGTDPLRLDQEVRDLRESLRRSASRDKFEIDGCHATRIKDIHRAMHDYRPRIVHFSGHGAGQDGIVFENESGHPICVSANALAGFFKNFKNNVECVVLNACYSEAQAVEISKHIKYVIGMADTIDDDIAIQFSEAFYDAIFADKPYDAAFECARSVVAMADDAQGLIPMIKINYDLVHVEEDLGRAIMLMNAGNIRDSIEMLNRICVLDSVPACLLLSMIYREGLGDVDADISKANTHLAVAKKLTYDNADSWVTEGSQLYDPNVPSLLPVAYLTNALSCGNTVPQDMFIKIVRLFYLLRFYVPAIKYALYGANILHDNWCSMVLNELKQNYPDLFTKVIESNTVMI